MAVLTGKGATENRAGYIEIATDAEAFAGADVDRAITPDQLLAVVGQGVAAVAGGLIYKGTFDATAQQPDLSFAVQGHFYKIEVAGQAFGQSFSVGDMLLINEDMNGVIDNAKIDKIDNGEALAQLDDLVDVTIVNKVSGQVLRYDGADWVNETISADDLLGDFDATNYTAGAAQSILIHLQGIDAELPNKADTVNSVAVANGAVTIDSGDIVGDYNAVNYSAVDTDTITAHLTAIDTEINNRADTVNGVAVAAGTVTIASDDIVGEHTGVNYTGANTDTITDHLSGIDTELGNLDAAIGALDADDLPADFLATNYTGLATDSIKTHLQGIDGELPNKADTVNSVAVVNGAVTIDSDDIVGAVNPVNYEANNLDTISSHLSAIDTEINNRADTVNGQAVANGAVTIDADDLTGEHVGVNYTGLATDTVKAHLSGIDTELGSLDSKIDALELTDMTDVSLTGTLSEGEALRWSGAAWVDARLSSDDIDADHQGVNYTGVDNTVTGQLAGIDNELPNKADTVNSVAVANGAVVIDGDDIVAPHAAVNYTGLNTDTVTTHLSGIDSQLGNVATSINNIQAQNNNVVLDADDLPSDYDATHYTGAAADSIKTHLSGIDDELNNRADTVNGQAVANGAVTINSDDIVGNRAGTNYAAVNTDTITAHLAAIDTDLGTLDTKIDNLSLNPLTDVTISGTLTDGETLRYSIVAGEWVDSRLSSDDIDSDHTAVNFTAGDATVTGHLSGLDAELPNKADTVNGVAVAAGAVTIDGDDIVAPHTGVNYTGANTDTVTTHFNLVDAKLGDIDGTIAALDLNALGSVNLSGTLSAGEVMRYDGAEWVDARLSSDDVDSDHAAVNYTAADATVTGHFSGLDAELENKADTVNSIAVVNGDVTIAGGDIEAGHTGVNYTGLNTDTLADHLSGVDTELGALDTKIDNLSLNPLTDVTISGTLTNGETLRYDANASQWVDRRLGSDDIDSEHAATNYTPADATLTGHLSGIDGELGSVATSINNIQAQNNNIALDADDLPADYDATHYTGAAADSVKTHLTGIDDELNNRADTVNSIAVVNGAVTIGSDDIVGERAGSNYTALITDSITTHLAGLDNELPNKADTVNSVAVVNGAVTIGSDDIVGERAGTNYTALITDSITTHLAGLDAELPSKADTVNGVAVAAGAVTIDSGDIVGDHTGVNYTGLNTDTLSTHLSGIDTELGALDTAITSLDVGDLTSVSLSGTLSQGEVLRYSGAAWVDSKLLGGDVTADRAGVQYTALATASVKDHLAAIDVEFNNRAEQVNGVAAVNGSITIEADDITAPVIPTNYTANNTDHIATHLSAIDVELGALDTAISSVDLGDLTTVSLTGTLSAGEVIVYDGANWVDATLSTDDVDSDHAAVNYTAADATVTGHLSGLDTELANKADTVNGVAVAAGSVTIDADDLVAPHTAVNYTAANTDSVLDHLQGIDSALAVAVSNAGIDDLNDVVLTGTLSAGEVLRYDGANWVDAQLSYADLSNTPAIPDSSDDIDSDHAAVNYTPADVTVTGHLSGLDTELDNKASTVNSVAVAGGSVTIDSGDIVGDHTGVNYTAANTDTISAHLSGIDTELGSLDTAIGALDVGDLTSVALTGTLSAGEVLRYDGASWVDAQLSYNDLTNTPTIPSDSDDITGVHTGVNYTAANTDTLTTHLSAIDNKIGTLEGAGSVDDVSTASTLVRGRLYQATNATAVTHTLPASADSEEGDKIRLYRSQAAGLVTIQQNGGDAGSIIRTAEGFVSSFTVNLQGEYVEVVYDADDSVWRVVQERAAYIEAAIITTSDPYTITRPNALFVLDAAGTTRINVTLPPYANLKSGDSFRFTVNADREVELNTDAADSGTVNFILAGANDGDQIVIDALAGHIFEVKCLSNGGTDRFIVESALGTASKYDVGTSAGNIVQLDGTGKLPAIDGSQLTNIAGGGGGGLNFDRKSANFTATVNYHYSITTATAAVTMTLPAISAVGDGDQVRLYFRERGSTNDITIDVAAASGDLINGASSFTMDIQYESYTFVANTTDAIWEVV